MSVDAYIPQCYGQLCTRVKEKGSVTCRIRHVLRVYPESVLDPLQSYLAPAPAGYTSVSAPHTSRKNTPPWYRIRRHKKTPQNRQKCPIQGIVAAGSPHQDSRREHVCLVSRRGDSRGSQGKCWPVDPQRQGRAYGRLRRALTLLRRACVLVGQICLTKTR